MEAFEALTAPILIRVLRKHAEPKRAEPQGVNNDSHQTKGTKPP